MILAVALFAVIGLGTAVASLAASIVAHVGL